MILKRHKDFLNESNTTEYYGYIGKDFVTNLKIGDTLIQHSTWPEGHEGDNGAVDRMSMTVLKVDSDHLVTVDGIGFTMDQLSDMNDDTSETYADFEDSIKETYFDDAGKDEHGFFFIDVYTGSKLYYMYEDQAKNKQVYKDAAKFGMLENNYDDKLAGKGTDLTYLLSQLKELIDGNDSYKAHVKKEGESIVITHETPGMKQKMIIKDNNKPNDFFYISGTDEKGKSIDDMGEQPSETIFVEVSKLFQEL